MTGVAGGEATLRILTDRPLPEAGATGRSLGLSLAEGRLDAPALAGASALAAAAGGRVEAVGGEHPTLSVHLPEYVEMAPPPAGA